eukprot:TRINITY_DN12671_c0_g2_i4.p1 TRINITY_DN12671_c0_g2~~TRINITY_DN12671_c0_g2_i4.p1  ORF type:complete len:197 (+),score=26.73 TRINITY_DN12671_c0_g2_i4:367-957(+)
MSIRNPFEVVKQNQQYQKTSKTLEIMRAIYNKRGLRGFYTGYGTLLIRELPTSTLELVILEAMLRKFEQHVSRYRVSKESLVMIRVAGVGVLGGIAYGLAGLITTPIDVIKSRIMVNALNPMSFLTCLTNTVRNEGAMALAKGGLMRVILGTPGGILYYFILYLGLTSVKADSTFFDIRKCPALYTPSLFTVIINI